VVRVFAIIPEVCRNSGDARQLYPQASSHKKFSIGMTTSV
jgi:hypothetical protein